MSPFHQMSMLRKASFVQMERQEANAIIASGRRRSSKPLNPVGLALPREATEASKINGLRNRLEKNGFIILQGFSTEPPKWSRTNPNLKEHHKVCPTRGRRRSRTAVSLARLKAC
jgi:hypothetical protein